MKGWSEAKETANKQKAAALKARKDARKKKREARRAAKRKTNK